MKPDPGAIASLLVVRAKSCGLVSGSKVPGKVLDCWWVGIVSDTIGCIAQGVLKLVLAC